MTILNISDCSLNSIDVGNSSLKELTFHKVKINNGIVLPTTITKLYVHDVIHKNDIRNLENCLVVVLDLWSVRISTPVKPSNLICNSLKRLASYRSFVDGIENASKNITYLYYFVDNSCNKSKRQIVDILNSCLFLVEFVLWHYKDILLTLPSTITYLFCGFCDVSKLLNLKSLNLLSEIEFSTSIGA